MAQVMTDQEHRFSRSTPFLLPKQNAEYATGNLAPKKEQLRCTGHSCRTCLQVARKISWCERQYLIAGTILLPNAAEKHLYFNKPPTMPRMAYTPNTDALKTLDVHNMFVDVADKLHKSPELSSHLRQACLRIWEVVQGREPDLRSPERAAPLAIF